MTQQFCKVSNKSSGRVVYKNKELNIRREFYPHETKNISIEELEKVAQTPGGLNILMNYLMIEDKDVAMRLVNREIPLEYWFNEKDIPNWMNTCTLDQFKDALDFAPQGTKDLIKQYAFDMPLNDMAKRRAIKDQLGFDVDVALRNAKPDPEDAQPNNKPNTRRVAQPVEEAPKRRVQIPTE